MRLAHAWRTRLAALPRPIASSGVVALALIASASCSSDGVRPGSSSPTIAPPADDLDVDVFVGTGGDHGQLDPAASVPFGLVKVGPDTSPGSHAGYDFFAPYVRGISHTRIGGVGCAGTGGDVRIVPGVGALPDGVPPPLAIDKASETAGPGWWSGALELGGGNRVHIDLTATRHAAMHAYTFTCRGPDCAPHLYFDLNRQLAFPGTGSFRASPDGREISGQVTSATVCLYGRYTLHYVATFDPPFTSFGESSGAPGSGTDVAIAFSPVDVVRVRVGLSSVDVEGARENLETELEGTDFVTTRDAAIGSWRERLAPIEVDGDAETVRLFRTMLYRSQLTPMDITDAGGSYRGTDRMVHAAQGWRRHHGWSTWDTYRTKHPLLALVDPERAEDIARSVVELYAQGKAAWATDAEPAPTVRADRAGVVLLDSLRKGLSVDVAPALDAIVAEAMRPEPAGPDARIEAAYDAWAAAGLLERAGRAVPDELRSRYARWQDVWTTSFRDMGDDADVVEARGLYEGTPWQHRWSPVFDVATMMALDDGPSAFASKLDFFFENELYNHGNEPDLHAAFLYVAAGRPWKAQEWATRILRGELRQWYGTHAKWEAPVAGPLYRLAPGGLLREMDDDDGTMAAWYVFAAIGLYPLAPGIPYYVVTRPRFDRVTIRTGAPRATRRELVIRVEGGGAYVVGATLNGVTLDRAWLTHDEVIAGGTLVLATSAAPSEAWATGEAAALPSWTP